MEQRIRSDEEIAALWGAQLEQQYINDTSQSGDGAYVSRNRTLDTTGKGSTDIYLEVSPSGSDNLSMPTGNLSNLDGGSESQSTISINGSLGVGIPRNFTEEVLNDFIAADVPDTVLVDDLIKTKVKNELDLMACEQIFSDKLTGDGSQSEHGMFPRPFQIPGPPPRPAAVSQYDRCITPQMSNIQRSLRLPQSPGNRKNTSEIFHFTYERDPSKPESSVPPFVIVPTAGVSKVTVRPTATTVRDPVAHQERGGWFCRKAVVFSLVSLLILAMVTLAAGILKEREGGDSDLSITPKLPEQATSTWVPSTPPEPSTTVPSMKPTLGALPASSPTLRPVLVVSNPDNDVVFPDMGGGIVAREETATPTTSDYVAPTRPPRTRRPTVSPSPSLSSSPSASPSNEMDSLTVPASSILPSNAISSTSKPLVTPTPKPSFAPTLPTFSIPSIVHSIPPESMPPSPMPHDGPATETRAYLLNVLITRSPGTISHLQDHGSPQTKAFEWLLQDQFGTGAVLPIEKLLQRFVLGTLYYATGGATWLNSTHWLSERDECDWHTTRTSGSTCDRNGILHTIHLEGNGLSGYLFSELGLLSLRRLFLRNNNIGGTIPPEIGHVVSLQHLQISNNNLESSIPLELCDLTNLVNLGMENNSLNSTLPTELGQLIALDTVRLEDNNFEGTIPSELGEIDMLRFVSVGGNSLTGEIPPEFGNLFFLEKFRARKNLLSGSMPEEVCYLRNDTLKVLEVDCDDVVCKCCTNCFV